MKILVPTDFSENAKHAAKYAAKLADELGVSQMSLLHVVQPPVTRNNIVYPLVTEELVRLRQEATKKLSDECDTLTEENEIFCSFQIATGNVIEEIVHKAQLFEADIIVMGTKGAHGIDKLVYGSNTSAVIESAPCLVIAVPENASLAIPRKIAYATDYENTDLETLKTLSDFCSLLNAELTVIHVSKESKKSDRDLIESFSKRIALETNCPQPYYYVVANDNIAKGIESFIESTGSQLIALSTHKRNAIDKLLHPSLTKKLVQRTKLPLLAFQAEAQ